MSEAERKQIEGMALLEVEEAKRALAILRAKADQWSGFHDQVSRMLGHAKRRSVTLLLDPDCKVERWNLENAAPTFGDAMNIGAILALDDELKAACERLKKAEETKKELGFS